VSRAPAKGDTQAKGARTKKPVGSRTFERRRRRESARGTRRHATRQRAKLARGRSALGLRAHLARVPAAAWVCALVAFLNGAAWSIITPPFQGRDEPDHFAYVQQLAETGTLPHSAEGGLSPQEELVLQGVHQYEVKLAPQNPAISTASEQRALARDLASGSSTVGSGDAGVATSEPPLYYALETIPYALGGGNTLAQLELMRLSGALLAAITALLAFFFLRELLPGVPWASTVGAACVAVQPLFGFMSGTVNSDVLLYTICAAIFLCLARAFRRGFTMPSAIALGVLSAVGFLTKLNFAGIAAGALVGLILLTVREVRRTGRRGIRQLGAALGIGASPLLIYAIVKGVSIHSTPGSLSLGAFAYQRASLPGEMSYIWQLYLPPLPGMKHVFPGIFMLRDIWFNRSVGLYGWLDTQFPDWVDNLALVPAGAIALLCARALYLQRGALRARVAELSAYAAIGVGVLVMVGAASYSSSIATEGVKGFGDPRYLLTLLPLLGAVVALAVRGGRRRWAPTIGAAILVAFLAHDLFSQLQVVARYYG
jgi:hypothetical protein